jgi:serine/threonine protein kinase
VIEFPKVGIVTLEENILGSGGSSYVYPATGPNNEPFAVKVVRANGASEGLTERVQTEINNPLEPNEYILRPLDNTMVESYGLSIPCLVFPRVEAQELGEFSTEVEPSAHGLAKRIAVASNMVSLLSNVHEQGYIHGDVSPKNFLLNRATDEVYLIDFETLTHQTGPRQDRRWANSVFMAPEVDQHGIKALSQASDIWSLGLVMIEWLAPQVWELDQLDDGWAEIFNHRKEAGLPPEEVVSSIVTQRAPKGLEPFWEGIKQCLSINAKDRPSIRALSKIFKEA